MNLDHLEQLATAATDGQWTYANFGDEVRPFGIATHDWDERGDVGWEIGAVENEADAAFIAAFNPEVTAALVEVAQAAQEVGDSNFRKLLELLGREGHDEAALRVLNFRKALAKLDNLEPKEPNATSS